MMDKYFLFENGTALNPMGVTHSIHDRGGSTYFLG